MSRPMSISEGKIILTYEDYLALPDDGKRYEILDGEISTQLTPTPRHQIVSGNLLLALADHVQKNDLGQVFHARLTVILSSTCVVEPDLMFVSKARNEISTDTGIAGTPDILIEILSPSTSRTDRVTKAQIYARHQVPAYWIVDPEQETVEVFLLNADSYRLAATLQGEAPMSMPPFTDFALATRDIFS